MTYILKDEELTEDGAFVDAGREGELTRTIVILQMGGNMDDVKAAEEVKVVGAARRLARRAARRATSRHRAKEPQEWRRAVVEELSNGWRSL